MHSFFAQAFSSNPALQLEFAEDEYSAEWQANRFADHLLVPTLVVSRYTDAASLAKACAVEQSVSERRIQSARMQWWPLIPAGSGASRL